MSISPGTVFLGLTAPDHGDARLNRRQVSILQAFARDAGSGFTAPGALRSSAASEAYYRLVRNRRVAVDAIIEPHLTEVYMQETTGWLLVAHDTTSIRHATADEASDVYDLGGGLKGYLAHVGLLIDEHHAAPIGVGQLEVVERTGEKGDEAARWIRGVDAVAERTRDRERVVHVCDREGDSYPLMSRICGHGQDFVIRECQDRTVVAGDECGRASVAAEQLPPIGRHVVEVPERRRTPPRPKEKKRTPQTQRTATLEVRVLEVHVQRPRKRSNEALPAELPLTLVVAKEVDPPAGEDPLDWRIWTSLPATTLEEAVRVLGIYKARWRIEELFKALKTGCSFGSTRFESRSTSARALALHLPIAAGLLRIRALGSIGDNIPASKVLDPTQLELLRALDKKLPQDPSAADVMWAVARLGGFLPQNKRVGWLVLGRGLSKLLTMAMAWKLARGEPLSALEEAAAAM